MRQCDGFFNVVLKQRRRAPVLATAIAGASFLLSSGASAQPTETAVKLLASVPVPVRTSVNKTGGLYGYDISYVDQSTQTYYLGDRSNAAVDAVNAATGAFIKQITASPNFAGATGDNSTSVPNGVTTGVVDGQTCLFAGDADGRVVSLPCPQLYPGQQRQDGGKRPARRAFAVEAHLVRS
jgi:hypothetical protein